MGTVFIVRMPQLGESVHEGTISKWLVKPGDKMVEFEAMLEIETDKVSAEVPAPVTGVLKEILAKEGQTVQAGAEIAMVELAADEATDGKDGKATATREAPAPSPKEVLPPTPASAEAVPAPAAVPESKPALEPSPRLVGSYSPAVQMLASEFDVDLSTLSGTGIAGRVTKKDVQEFVARAKAAPPAPAQLVQPSAGGEVVQLTRVRRLIAENMTRSKQTIPHAWQTQEADMSGVVANRNANKVTFQRKEGFALTYLPYVMAAALSALRQHPQVNATFNETELIIHRDINLGVSVGLEDTLLVPVIRRADSMSIAGLARAVNDLATRARNKQLKADELSGGTFTVNNSGTFGTLFSYSVINPGQAGILTMEAIVERPVALNGMIGIKPMMYLCLSLDHRVLDGMKAAQFLSACKRWLEGVSDETPIF